MGDMVQFRAMVTPCMPTCPPVTCDVLDYTGQNRQVESYGRKKRWLEPINRVKRSSEPDEVLVVQSLRIVDKSQKKSLSPSLPRVIDANVTDTWVVQEMELLPAVSSQRCVEENTLISGAVIFLVIQVIILTILSSCGKRSARTRPRK